MNAGSATTSLPNAEPYGAGVSLLLWGMLAAPWGVLATPWGTLVTPAGCRGGQAPFPHPALPWQSWLWGVRVRVRSQPEAAEFGPGYFRACSPPMRGNVVSTATAQGGWPSPQGAPQQPFAGLYVPSPQPPQLFLKGQETLCEEGGCGDAPLRRGTLSQVSKGRGRKAELMRWRGH